MSKHLDRDFNQLKQDLLSTGGLVEEAIRKAGKALLERRSDLGVEVNEQDSAIDDWEVHVEEDCLKILALHHPVAEDLRFVTTVMKINNDLERLGDLAANIARRAKTLSEQPALEVSERLQAMFDMVTSMVHKSLNAFVNGDVQLAQEVCASDDEVDNHNRKILKELRQLMKDSPDNVDRATLLFSTSRYLERIGDHATNIAEDVIYMVKGDIVRHRGESLDAS